MTAFLLFNCLRCFDGASVKVRVTTNHYGWRWARYFTNQGKVVRVFKTAPDLPRFRKFSASV